MTPALFWVLLFIGALATFPAGWRIGYRAGRRDRSAVIAEEWNEHVDQALLVFRGETGNAIPDDMRESMTRHPSNLTHLRDHRHKIT